tara:strand:+ start:267 stop:587 length:321 start_codon:yes stop_codon:yes gene_type:complete
MDYTIQAYMNLAPTGQFTINTDEDGNDTIDWLTHFVTQPTKSEIRKEIKRLKREEEGVEYKKLRRKKYKLLNQDELRYDDIKNGTTTWVDAIEAIKLQHPKPSKNV